MFPTFFYAALLVVLMEAATSLTTGRGWALPGPGPLLVGTILAFAVFGLLFLLRVPPRRALRAGALFLVFEAFVNASKLDFLGLPYLPWDVLSTGQTLNLLPFLKAQLLVPAAAFAFLGLVAWGLAPRFAPKRAPRLSPVLALAAGAAVLVQPPAVVPILENLGVQDMIWVPVETYQRNGFLVGFAINVRRSFIIPPKGYARAPVEALAGASPAEALARPARRPNVIVVMSEAFWDPTLLSGVTYSRDPLPNVHALAKRHPSGYLFSPSFGGGTSNVEFEALTGFSTAFLPPGSNAYQQFVHAPLPSLPALTKGLGYTATAIHSYHDWFWNRRTVYPALGFDKFISQTELPAPKKKGLYIADAELARAITSRTDETQGPDFVYAVTMQNHGPYNDDRYGDAYELSVTAPGVRDAAQRPAVEQILRTYGQGVLDADRLLGALVSHYEKASEPTVIVFFGDHLPMLGPNFLTYDQLGYSDPAKQPTGETYAPMHSTPLVVWSNFGPGKLPAELGRVDASFLPALLFEQLELKPTGYYGFLETAYRKVTLLGTDIEGLAKRKDPPEAALLHEYELIQHDQMFGAHYLKRPWFSR